MKSNKTAIIFLIKFFGTYLVLSLLYAGFLSNSKSIANLNSCDSITKDVAVKTEKVIKLFGIPVSSVPMDNEPSVQLLINNIPIARVVEGCNAISVIILFVSFIIAFSSGILKTSIFAIVGSFLLYFLNIVRIAFLTIGIWEYPHYSNFLHQIVFPVVIYGITFGLWIIWVTFFISKKNE